MLFEKFDNDVKKRSRLKRFLLVLDQMINVLLWNGSQDETVSSHLYRRKEKGVLKKYEKWLCNFLKQFEKNHCKKSLGE